MARKSKQNYITSQELYEGFLDWYNSSPILEQRIPSERLGKQLMLMAEHLLTHKNFRGYPKHIKDDMMSDGVLKCLINLKNIDPIKAPTTLFSYYTRCLWCAYITTLKYHYKHLNRQKELLLDELEKQQCVSPNLQNQQTIKMLKEELRRYEVGTEETSEEDFEIE